MLGRGLSSRRRAGLGAPVPGDAGAPTRASCCGCHSTRCAPWTRLARRPGPLGGGVRSSPVRRHDRDRHRRGRGELAAHARRRQPLEAGPARGADDEQRRVALLGDDLRAVEHVSLLDERLVGMELLALDPRPQRDLRRVALVRRSRPSTRRAGTAARDTGRRGRRRAGAPSTARSGQRTGRPRSRSRRGSSARRRARSRGPRPRYREDDDDRRGESPHELARHAAQTDQGRSERPTMRPTMSASASWRASAAASPSSALSAWTISSSRTRSTGASCSRMR